MCIDGDVIEWILVMLAVIPLFGITYEIGHRNGREGR